MQTYQILQLIDIAIDNAITENQEKILTKARDELIEEQIGHLIKVDLSWFESFYGQEDKSVNKVKAVFEYKRDIMPEASIVIVKKYIDRESQKFLASKSIKKN